MLLRFRNIVVLLLLALSCGSLFATVSATAKLTISGTEQQPSGVWDSGTIDISFNGFSESANYAQFSNPASLASALAAMFTRDYNRYGLWAKAGASSNTDPNVITFQLTNGQTFTSINYSVPSTSFALATSGFAASSGAPVPVISSVSPSSAYAGQNVPIEIYGSNFGTGALTVTFNGAPVTSFSYQSPTVIVSNVPAGATTGSIVVTVGGVSSLGVPYTILPVPSITSVSPTSGVPGSPITIVGKDLASCTGLAFGSTYSSVAPSATSLGAVVQSGAAPAAGGSVSIELVCNSFQTNSVAFNVLPAPPPTITSVTPAAIYDAQTYGSLLSNVTITGTNFGSAGTVNYNSAPPVTYSSSDGKTIVISAFEARTGPMTVTTSGATSNSLTFTVASAPTITSISPRSGAVGSTMQITGTNLAAVSGTALAGCGTLLFNSTPVAVSPSSSTTVSAVVPAAAAAGPGPVSLTCNGYQTGSAQFTVGTAYDNGNVALTVNGVTDSVLYGKGQNATSAAVAASLISAVNADPNAFVNAAANGSTGITLTSRDPGTATKYAFSLADNYDAYDFSAASYAFTPVSGTLTGGADAVVNSSSVYCYSITTKVPSNCSSYTQPVAANTGYDPDGNVVNYWDSLASGSVMGTWSFGYDPLNRMLSANVASGSYIGTSLAGATMGWSYDYFGNRLTQSSSSGVLPTGSTQFTGANNQATGTGLASSPGTSTTTLQYDASGNMTGKNGATQSIYDAEGRLCATQISAGGYEGYVYDAEGHRVAKGTITSLSCNMATNGWTLASQYLLGPAGEQMTELNGTGVWVHTNVTANGSLFATFDNDNKGVHFTLTDWLGTKRVQTNYLGAVEETCQSLPFGDGLNCSGSVSDATEHHFTSKERDTETGNDYFLARYYNSSMGRFMSPDWSAKEDPVPYAKLDDPQSLNLYGYVRNNPLGKADPDGHCPWCLAVAGGGVLADEAPLAALGPVGWGVIGVTAVGVAAYATYQHFHQDASAENAPAAPAAAATEQPRTADGKFAPKTGAEAAPGAAAEVGGLGAIGATKNTAKIPGSSRIPDGVTEDGQYAEVKSGTSISNTKQLAEMGAAAVKATGQALIVVVTNPNATITKQANSNPNLDIRRIPPPQ